MKNIFENQFPIPLVGLFAGSPEIYATLFAILGGVVVDYGLLLVVPLFACAQFVKWE